MTYYLKFSHQSDVNKTKPVVTADRLTQFSGVSMMSRWSRSDRVGLLAAGLSLHWGHSSMGARLFCMVIAGGEN